MSKVFHLDGTGPLGPTKTGRGRQVETTVIPPAFKQIKTYLKSRSKDSNIGPIMDMNAGFAQQARIFFFNFSKISY
jgi:hypothetical protein